MGDELDIVLELGKQHGIDEAIDVYTSKVEVKEWVRARCSFGCPHYKTNWCCPPQSLGVQNTKTLLGEYKKAVLVLGKDGQEKQFRAAVLEMEKALREKGFYKAFALTNCPCDLCEECTFKTGRLCNYPDRKRPTFGGCGIDIVGLVRRFKKNFQVPEKGFWPAALLLVD